MSYVKPLPVGAKKSLLESSTVAPSSNGKLNDNGVVGTGIVGGGGGTTTTNGSTALSMSDASAPKLPPKPVREQVRVIFSYTAQNEDELTIKEGDIITVISKENEDVGWWKGELNGRIALFPDNFIEPFQSTAPPPTAAKPEMNNNTTNTANNNNGTVLSAVEKIGIKKPERPSSLVKPQSKSNNETVDTSPAVTPTSPASPAFGGNSVASKKLMFAHVSSQFQQQNKPPAPSVGRQTSKTNSNDSQDADAKKIKSPTSDGDPNEPGRLVHLTALRPKIPTTARRPPSMPTFRNSSVIEDNTLPSPSAGEAGDTQDSRKETPQENGTITAMPVEKKSVPWYNDLVRAQQVRNLPKPTPSASSSAATASVPERSTTTTTTESASVAKPVAPTNKPVLPTSIKPVHSVPADEVIDSSQVTNKTVPHSSSVSTASAKEFSPPTASTTELNEMKDELSKLRSEMRDITNKYDKLKSDYGQLNATVQSQSELVAHKSALEAMVREQTESFAAHKKAMSEMVKDLINDLSKEKKKVANLQIEIDRIQKLHTAVYEMPN